MKLLFESYVKFIGFFVVFHVHVIYSLNVRVLLNICDRPEWVLRSSRGFILKNAKNYNELPAKATYSSLTIQASHDGYFIINGKKNKMMSIYIDPISSGGTHFDKKIYEGSFIITYYRHKYYLINVLELENYVYSVLKTESWPGWPLEINKVLAITCRTYLLYHLIEARRSKQVYDVKNTNSHQTYNGIHVSHILRQSVDDTCGLFIAYNKKPILAMFDCCCGGVIPVHMDVIDVNKFPYLARNYKCNYCKSAKVFSWEKQYSKEQLENLLNDTINIRGYNNINVSVVKHDKSGIVKQVCFKFGKRKIFISGKKLYQLLKLKSCVFTIDKKNKQFIFSGYGYGHHIGLCQWGAREMVKQEIDYEKILSFYYPGTYLMKLNVVQKKLISVG